MYPQFLHKIYKILLCSIAIFFIFASPAQSAPYLLTVILSENSGAYKEFSDSLNELLKDSDVSITVTDTIQPPPPSNLVVAVGMKAATVVIKSNAPNILNVMIPQAGHSKLLQENPKRDIKSHYSTIYLDQPLDRQIKLIAAAFPDRRRLGVIFEPEKTNEINTIKKYSNDYGLELYANEVNSNTSMFESLQNVLQHSNVLLALPSPTIYNSTTLRNILVSTYQSKIPLVGFSASYVKAGAMCAVISTPAQFAKQTSTVILKFIETGELPPAQHPTLFEISVNDRVAQSMGVSIDSPDELFKKMSTIKRRAQ
jgi:ABC-type uncharacterized transport system substrate-binding protein